MQTDFLSNLLSRAIVTPKAEAAAGELRPRIASLFEPSLVSSHPIPAGMEADEPAASADADKAAPAAILTSPRREQPSIKRHAPLWHESEAVAQPDFEQDAKTRVVFRNRSEAAIPTPDAGSNPLLVPPVGNSVAREGNIRQVVVTSGIPSLVAPVAPLPQIQENPKRLKPEFAPSMPRPLTDGIENSPVKPADAMPLHNRDDVHAIREQTLAPQTLPMPKTETPPRLEPALIVPDGKSPAAAQRNELQPPTIHVTIGRIEVRASAQAVAPKRAASPSAGLSLDEYLRQRQDGNR